MNLIPPGYPIAQPGDVFFGMGKRGLAPFVRWAETSRGEEPTFANHTGGVTRPGYLVPPPGNRSAALAWVSESQWKNVHREFWAGYRGSPGYQVAVYRPRLVNDALVQAIVADWRSREGDQYAAWRLLTHLGEKLTSTLTFGKLTVPFTKLHKAGLKVCSHHIGTGYAAAGIHLGKAPDQSSPDDQIDYCNKHPDEWKFIGWAVVPQRKAA